jgi:hypothetical protein
VALALSVGVAAKAWPGMAALAAPKAVRPRATIKPNRMRPDRRLCVEPAWAELVAASLVPTPFVPSPFVPEPGAMRARISWALRTGAESSGARMVPLGWLEASN